MGAVNTCCEADKEQQILQDKFRLRLSATQYQQEDPSSMYSVSGEQQFVRFLPLDEDFPSLPAFVTHFRDMMRLELAKIATPLAQGCFKVYLPNECYIMEGGPSIRTGSGFCRLYSAGKLYFEGRISDWQMQEGLKVELAGGDRYFGRMAGGRYVGAGVLHRADGTVYSGTFLGGSFNGVGRLVYSDGST